MKGMGVTPGHVMPFHNQHRLAVMPSQQRGGHQPSHAGDDQDPA